MSRKRLLTGLAIVMAAFSGCDGEGAWRPVPGSGSVRVETGVVSRSARAPVTQDQLDLQGTADLIRDGRVRDGKALEATVNWNRRNRVDLDRDGKRDHIQVVEVRDGNTRLFELRAVPSSAPKREAAEEAMVVAIVEFRRDAAVARVSVRYADVVVVVHPIEITFEIAIVPGSFCYWVFLDRPIFIGVAYVVVVDRHNGKHRKYKEDD